MNDERVRNQVLSEQFRAGLIVENSLLKKINGNYILENLFVNNEKIPDCFFNQRESLRLILKYKRYDLLKKVSIRNLLRKKTKDKTYLDYILNLSKYEKDINLSFCNPFNGLYSIREIADFYIIYAKHDLLDYLPPLTEQELLKKEKDPMLKILTLNKDLLSLILGKCSDDIKEKLLPNKRLRNLDIVLRLNNDNEYTVPIGIEDTYSKEYIENENSTLESIYNYLRPREQALLKELYDSMKDKCDEEAIRTILYSYIEQLHYGDKKSIYVEIRRLIDIFKIDNNFKIEMGSDSYFSIVDNKIVLSDMKLSDFNHELAHALYHKLAGNVSDSYFHELVSRVRNNPNVLEKTNALSKRYQEKKKHIYAKAVDYYNERYFDEFSKDNVKRIEKMLASKKEDLIKEYQKKGYSKRVIENILNRSYTLDEYKKQHKKIQIASLIDSIKKTKIAPICQIADIVDAIYNGEFFSGKLKNANGEKIKPISGHGLFYYKNSKKTIFDEVFANYCAIRKNNELGVPYYVDPELGEINSAVDSLRAIVGNELVDYLESFYQREILDSKKYETIRSR